MIVFLLLVIIAILLFGSSVVLGAVGIVIGFLVACAALIKGLALFGLTLDEMLLPCSLALLALIAFAHLYKALQGDRLEK